MNDKQDTLDSVWYNDTGLTVYPKENDMRELPKLFGDKSETLATDFLEKEGFIIVERNYFARKLGEIDIIAQRDEVLHFIEVKSAKSDSFDPVYNVTAGKLRKVINSAHYYMKVKNIDTAYSIDALIIRADEVEYIENVTL
jgi:putative endonuclease